MALFGLGARNLLLTSFECMIDCVAPYPLLGPALLSRLRESLRMRSAGIRELIVAIHVLTDAWMIGLGGGWKGGREEEEEEKEGETKGQPAHVK